MQRTMALEPGYGPDGVARWRVEREVEADGPLRRLDGLSAALVSPLAPRQGRHSPPSASSVATPVTPIVNRRAGTRWQSGGDA